ncbi:MAG TPA: MoaD/ThiS family protein [Vicinamibacterales bacterium]|nr:MoaD/ThiS family protein [Vicinamibacterales bacterium]
MRVTVRLFARARDLVGKGEIVRNVREGATIRDVWQDLVAEYPVLVPYTHTVSCARNLEYARMNVQVADGDEIAFLPPVSGG